MEAEDPTRFAASIEPLEARIRETCAAMWRGRHGFDPADLRCLDLAATHAIPKRIDDAHRRGLAVGNRDE